MVRSIFMTIILLLGTFAIVKPSETSAFSSQLIERGSFGDDVIELQARLQWLGYYNGKIDGIFGYGTYWAVRNFQKEFDLDIDGVVGSTTKKNLVNATEYHEDWVKQQIDRGNQFTHYGGTPLAQQTKGGGGGGGGGGTSKSSDMQLPVKYSERDLQLMANAVYGEARGEPYEGQVAVAAVILNRLESPEFPNTISDIIFQPGAFTAVADGQIWLTPNERAKEAVLDAMNGWDPTENALFYFNPQTATSKWIWSRPQIKQIGEHIFCY
ncbi:N-acetylmuramoyl-L-alanine amidase [Ureibacillus xyleni]|uniref:Spore cortex-lytic enzyme n=1 Tax=Ureibacillus xyleni TaxID=614648 RepID=A0A285TD67_9BACL|nr:spore cortex-lytic enzyme [Ureibacillus xyleni]SOC20184.1 N-acetylmuramoyl-L-alanine amidase [Ureibacillus xyleni]